MRGRFDQLVRRGLVTAVEPFRRFGGHCGHYDRVKNPGGDIKTAYEFRRTADGGVHSRVVSTSLKRLIVGRPLSNDRPGEQGLPKRIALPVFASDPLSSVAYATQEILLVLTVGGMAYLRMAPWVAAVVVLLLAVVVLSYRQVVRAHPTGGGSYEVASRNLGTWAGLVVASALLVDYVMTVAVSVAAGVDNIISAFPSPDPYRVPVNLGFVLVLTAMNLRGVRESGRVFAVPTYLFVVGVLAMIFFGFAEMVFGHTPIAESTYMTIRSEPGSVGLTTLALTLLALRAFASGCTASTGVEAISNGVPAFRPPKARNAATTMTMMGALSIVMFAGITALAMIGRVHYVNDACQLTGFPGGCATGTQRTVIAQLAAAIFGGAHSVIFYIQAATALILILAANTAYNGLPLLSAILAEHRYLPHQLYTRGTGCRTPTPSSSSPRSRAVRSTPSAGTPAA